MQKGMSNEEFAELPRPSKKEIQGLIWIEHLATGYKILVGDE